MPQAETQFTPRHSDELLVEIVRASGKAGELRKSREAAMVITKLDEARLWLEEYRRKVYEDPKDAGS